MPTPPIAQLEENGKPAILSYNIPDPTSYPGRNYIALQIDPSWFDPTASPGTVVDDGSATIARVQGADGVSVPHFVSEHGVIALSGRQQGVVATGALDAAAIEAAQEAGLRPRVYTVLDDVLTYRIERDPLVALQNSADETGSNDDSGQVDQTVPYVEIAAPSDGGQIVGPSSGFALAIKGIAGLESGTGSITKVEVQVGTGNWKQATPQSTNNWSTWSLSENVTASGTYSVKARAIHSGGTLKAETSATVTIMLQAAQSPDPAPPTVQLTSPLAEAIVVAPTGSISLEVKGTAVDEGANASGVDFVEVAVDGGTPVKATPKASGNWSEWKASIPVSGERAHQITARAVDKGGLSSTVGIRIQLVKQPIVEPLLARLVLVESYRLSTFAGNYGAGKTLRTFSLLAGEETTISIKSYQRTEATSKQASSILDSYTTESATEFAQAVEREQSYKENYQDSFNYNVNGGTNASWGWGSASIDAGVSGGTNAAREEFAKNVINATQKHAAKASAKRDVQINTSFEVKQESGEETSIERKIENLNVSRTLNYVFRQLNQQFISILHLIDARIAYVRVDLVNGQRRTTYREVTLPQLDSLLADVIREPYRQRVRNAIAYQLQFVFDYKDVPWAFVEEKDLSGADGKPVPNTKFLRVRRDLFPTYKDENGNQYTVPGVILGATSTVLRTDSLIVDAILGRGEALDNYSQTLRNEASKSETLANGVTQSDIDRAALAVDLVKTKNADGAKIFEQVYGLGGSAAQAPPKAIAEELTTDGHHD